MPSFVFDIDGTICSETYGKYDLAEPFIGRIKKINEAYDAGHKITYYTARGMGSNNNNVAEAYNKWYAFTEKQLGLWGAKYHTLFLGKPSGDIYVDDKGISDEQFF